MNRLVWLLLAVAVVPGPVAGQDSWNRHPGVELSPFIAVRFPQTLTTQRVNGGGAVQYEFSLQRPTTPVFGLEARLRFTDEWGLTAAAGYGLKGDQLYDVSVTGASSPTGLERRTSSYGHLVFVRADMQYRFPEPDPASDSRLHHPSLYAFAGPALVLGFPAADPVAPTYLTDGYVQVAGHFGLRAAGTIPFWSHIGYELVGEDFALLSNRSVYEDRLTRLFQENAATDASGTVTGRSGHVLGLRAGLVLHP